ncbi:replication fork protection component Swi3-domain-containing protein [Globomyces pollinis-pini]|nr:replication fork protection component Swi3-domain-containing protein [Globomyces pollinis-pini]
MPITVNKGISTTAKTTEDDAAPKRKVKRAPILKEDDLLSPMGFNKLIRIVKKKKFKGTGHEVQDLESLLSIIQNWGHELFPNLKLYDLICNTEKLCRSRRIRVYRNELLRERRQPSLGIYERQSEMTHHVTPSNPISDENHIEEIMEDEDFEIEIQQHLESQKVKEIEIQEDKLAQIELNRQKAMAKLQLRQLEREAQRVEQERQEEEARVAAMIAEAGHLFMD